MDVINKIRATRALLKVPPKVLLPIAVKSEEDMSSAEGFILRLARASAVEFADHIPHSFLLNAVNAQVVVGIDLQGQVDIVSETPRFSAEVKAAQQELQAIESRLKNPNFVDKAPAEVLDETRAKQADLQQKIIILKDVINKLSKVS